MSTTATVIPAGLRVIDLEDMSIDLVCFHHACTALGDRRAAGKIVGYVEATLEANPGLANKGVLIPLGTVVTMPEFALQATVETSSRRLWD